MSIVMRLLIIGCLSLFILGLGDKTDQLPQSVNELESTSQENADASSSVAANQIDVYVNGMTCAMCAQGIEAKLKETKYIDSISVDFDTKRVSVFCNNKEKVTNEKIAQAIDWAGYDVIKIVRYDSI